LGWGLGEVLTAPSPLKRVLIYDMIYLVTAIGLTLGGSSTVHIYTQTVHRTTKLTRTIQLTIEQYN
jgi:uncharacterized integral membrane protein